MENVLKGVIRTRKKADGSEDFVMEYLGDHNVITYVDVDQYRLRDLQSVGYVYNDGDECEFVIKKIETFPYVVAAIVHTVEVNTTNTANFSTATVYTPEPEVRRTNRYHLRISGTNDSYWTKIEADNFDTNSAGYYYFYNEDDRSRAGRRKYIAFAPIINTFISQIEYDVPETPPEEKND